VPDLSLTRILQLLPAGVFLWMVFGAGMIFSPHVGRRDPRGFGIALTFWGAWAAKSVGMIPPLWVSAVGGAGLLASLALFQWAAISIRGRMFSYAGNDDLPQFVHQGGPYAYIRNPFYASYLLAELSTVVMGPSVWGAAVVVLAAGYFQWLARFEEQKFSRSPVAAEYGQYKARTGRLLPRVRK
jgi:protein-S-isoprenylcysteine O-methyltransferase Ste14